MDINIKQLLNVNTLREHKKLVFIIVVILVTVFLGKKIFDTQKKQTISIKKDIERFKKEASLANDINKLSVEIDKFQGAGWLTDESVDIMGKINEIAGKHGIEIFKFNPGGVKKQGNYSTMSMSLDIGAGYFELTRFFAEIEEMEALTKITSLHMIPERNYDEELGPRIKASLSIEAFILLQK